MIGQLANTVKVEIQSLIAEQGKRLEQMQWQQQLEEEDIDTTLPGRRLPLGSYHPIQLILDELVSILDRLGYTVETGPELENEFHNFEALNIAEDHPARDMHDTFLPELRIAVTYPHIPGTNPCYAI